jgi:ATP-binding cassette, subfamily B, bacterial CvaB/MchF/RaxB
MLDLFSRRAPIELQTRLADCGYICASAVLAHHGLRLKVADIKAIAGETSRGLKLRQLRDVLSACGAQADAVRFDPNDAKTYPVPGVVLLTRGHYVALTSVRGNSFVAYYPERGWLRIRARDIAGSLTGLGVMVAKVTASPSSGRKGATVKKQALAARLILSAVRSPLGKGVIGLSAATQLIVLLLPLVSMLSADRFKLGADAGYLGQIGIGFILISLTSSIARVLSTVLNNLVFRRVSLDLAADTFNRLLAKPPRWFDEVLPDSVRNAVNSLDNIQKFCAELLPLIGSLMMTALIGFIAFFFFSPWLALPGLTFVLINVAMELAFHTYKSRIIVNFIDAIQRRSAFVLDVLTQAPLLLRQGGVRRSRRNYLRITRRWVEADADMERFNNIKAAVASALKACENLVFVSLAALFMGKENYTLGAFVAVGAYKDLVSQALGSGFQMVERYRTLDTHVRQSEEIVEQEPIGRLERRRVTEGRVSVRDLGFQYSAFDAPTLSQVSFELEPGDFVVVAGPSGAGKSTLVKLLCGLLAPTTGHIRFDGSEYGGLWDGMASMLQNERLIAGSVRDNITMFRGGVPDDDIYRALRVAELEDFVLSLPMRLDTMVSDSAGGLSGGQRQRLLLARTVLSRPKLLVLDEATSALDVDMEGRVLANLANLSATIILVAHRPETWTYATKILEVDEGGVRLRSTGAASKESSRRDAIASRTS